MSSQPTPLGMSGPMKSRCSALSSFSSGRSPYRTLWREPGLRRPLSDADTTYELRVTSISTLRLEDSRTADGNSPGMAGRSLTTVSSSAPWVRRPRTTTPLR